MLGEEYMGVHILRQLQNIYLISSKRYLERLQYVRPRKVASTLDLQVNSSRARF